MRFANLDGRLALSTPGGYADVASVVSVHEHDVTRTNPQKESP